MSKSSKGSGTASETSISRREALKYGAGVAGSALLVPAITHAATASNSNNLPPNTPKWMQSPGADVGSEPYGSPSKFEDDVIRRFEGKGNLKQYTSASFRTPLQDLDGTITPNGLFYVRDHGGTPAINPDEHRLMVHGLVNKPLIFTMEELRRFPSVSRIHFLECSGNPLYGAAMKGRTAQDLFGLVSGTQWTGVPLKEVLDEVGLQDDAKWIVAEGADAAGMTRSIPIEKCLDDAMLVYSQNGERLRPQQGYPLRLIVPGFEGNMNVKWLRRLHVRDSPVYSREETSKYTDLLPDGTARQFTFYMEAKSIITHPSGTHVISRGFNEISGIAWSGHGKIEHVDVSVDNGRNWREAALDEPVLDKALTRFRLPWKWDGKPAIIMSRATDETGYVQPAFEQLASKRGLHSIYHNNTIMPWFVAENGEVSNAYAED